ncbi:MAG: hypothetical protein ACLUD0_07065 [Eubacterium ramulus]
MLRSLIPLQVDEKGNIANWIIPGKMVSWEWVELWTFVVGAKRVIVAMEHTQKGAPKILKRCTSFTSDNLKLR